MDFDGDHLNLIHFTRSDPQRHQGGQPAHEESKARRHRVCPCEQSSSVLSGGSGSFLVRITITIAIAPCCPQENDI